MHISNIWRLAVLMLVLLVSPTVWADCLPNASSVTEEDMEHPPWGMWAFKAQIIRVLPHGPLSIKPHRGFGVDFKILEKYQGEIQADTISLEYGGCQSPPGHAGDIVNVLAMPDRNVDWYAPEFWTRGE